MDGPATLATAPAHGEVGRHAGQAPARNPELLQAQSSFRRGRSHQREYQSPAAPRSRLSRHLLPAAQSTTTGRYQDRVHCFSEGRMKCVLRHFLAESPISSISVDILFLL